MTFDRSDYINQPIPIEDELSFLFNKSKSLTIFEIGACEGEDSIKYARMFPDSNIYIFEPLPKNIEYIKGNLSKYGIKNVKYFDIALSSENGNADFYISKGRPKGAPETDWDYGNKSSSLLLPDKHQELAPFIKFEDKIIVPTITLHSFCKENNISEIDFIHMDVQGAELMVLQGAGELLNSIKAIWLEVSKVHIYKNQPLADDVYKFMQEHNFVLFKDYMEGLQGDHLYISKTFYPNVNLYTNSSSFWGKILRRLRGVF
jgi:2-O-methyltransferase